MNIVRRLIDRIVKILTGTGVYCVCLFFCIAFHIVQNTKNVSGTDLAELMNQLQLLLTAFLSVRFLLAPKKKIYNLVWLVCYGLLFVSYRVGDNRTLLDTFVLATSTYGADFKKVARSAKWAWLIVTAAIIAEPVSELIPLVSEIDWSASATRYNLGFLNHNTIGMVFFSVGLCLFISHCYKPRWIHIPEQALIFILCYYLTKSRTSSIGLALLLVFTVILKLPTGRWIRKCLKYEGVVIVLSSFGIAASAFALWMAACYDESSAFMTGLSELVHNRFRFASLYYQAYDILPWGREMTDVLYDTKFYLDSGYIYILLNGGLIAALIMLGLWTWSLYAAWKRRNAAVGIGISVLMIMLMMERQVATCHICWLLSYGFASVHSYGDAGGKRRRKASGGKDAEADAETGAETNAEAGIETGAEVGTEMNAETDAVAGMEMNAETGAETDVEAGMETDAETDVEACAETNAAAEDEITVMDGVGTDAGDGTETSAESGTSTCKAPDETVKGKEAADNSK